MTPRRGRSPVAACIAVSRRRASNLYLDYGEVVLFQVRSEYSAGYLIILHTRCKRRQVTKLCFPSCTVRKYVENVTYFQAPIVSTTTDYLKYYYTVLRKFKTTCCVLNQINSVFPSLCVIRFNKSLIYSYVICNMESR